MVKSISNNECISDRWVFYFGRNIQTLLGYQHNHQCYGYRLTHLRYILLRQRMKISKSIEAIDY